jgi:exopolyphosphatase / guanosine-5'-triphosphate,3'-diphosphate pyrophosphatase
LRRACIDIGSNTTRLLIADCDAGRLEVLHQERAFTQIGRGMLADGTIAEAKIAEVVEVVARQLRTAGGFGATDIRAVATAAIRGAANGAALLTAVRERCGIEIEILTGEEEARLAFIGAARMLGYEPTGELGVVDVGGGSSELVVGRFPDRVSWSASFAIGSSKVTQACIRSDPPSQDELDHARVRVEATLDDLEVPHPSEAVAVGGSATSLARLAGPVLDAEAFARSLRDLAAEPARSVASRFALDVERVRLLPAGLLILRVASERLGCPLKVAAGGLREGLLLESAGG